MKAQHRIIVLRFLHIFIIAVMLASALALPGLQTVQAANFDLNGPTGSGGFGASLTLLPDGNFVVVDPYYSPTPQVHIGAVYVYDGESRTLIDQMTGSSDEDRVGSGGIKVLNDGNFVVVSPRWNNGSATEAGAVTWCSASTGCPDQVSATNSLVGGASNDHIGVSYFAEDNYVDGNSVIPFTGSAYVVRSSGWRNSRGEVTYCSGGDDLDCIGEVSATNSLVGSTESDYTTNPSSPVVGDYIGQSVTEIPGQGYLVNTVFWTNGSEHGAGVVVLCPVSGGNGCTGAVSTANSLYGTQISDNVGQSITRVGDGGFVVVSISWGGGASQDGAVTYCASLTDPNCYGQPVSVTNSLTSTISNSTVGSGGIGVIDNEHYIVGSPSWKSDGSTRPGAATFCTITAGVSSCSGTVISVTNSMVGDQNGDGVGTNIFIHPDGGFLVSSLFWHDDKGALTYCSDYAACIGLTITSVNSLVGTNSGDNIGMNGIKILPDGSLAIASNGWNSSRGAVTFCSGTSCTGEVTSANSLLGAKENDKIAAYGIYITATGAILVDSPYWQNASDQVIGALTFCADADACKNQTVSASNSLIADNPAEDFIINGLPNGSYLVGDYNWSNQGATEYAGSVTWCPATGCQGMVINATNSLVGSHYYDYLGYSQYSVTDDAYLVVTSGWQNDAIEGAGAVTLCDSNSGCQGVINTTNSVIGAVPGIDYDSHMAPVYDTAHDLLIVGVPLENKVVFFNAINPVKTLPASGLTTTAATLNGSVNAMDVTTTVSFEYGLTNAYGTTLAATPNTVTGSTDTPVTAAISGLTPNTVYHYRVSATAGGVTTTGSDRTFTTVALPPTAVTGSATSVTDNTATLNGTVNASGVSAVVQFEYGLDDSYGSLATAAQSPLSGSTDKAVSAAISGLAANTVYHFRVDAQNSGGTNTGDDQTFTTAKTTATINLSNLSQVYNRNPRAATTTTTPSGLPVSLTYTGTGGTTYPTSTTAPTQVGTYTVDAQIDDASYQGSATDTLSITPLALTVNATGQDKIYDGTTTAQVTLRATPISGDEVNPTYTSAAFASKTIGSGKTVTVSGVSLSGADAGNYSAATTTTTTASITERSLTVTATGVDKAYDGTTAATVSLSTDKVTGDTVNPHYTSAAFTDAAVGEDKTVNVSGISIDGSDAGNYTLANTTATTTADITKPSTTTSLVADQATTAYSEAVTFTATVLPSGSTGTVTFQANGSNISGCVGVTLASGSAGCTTSGLDADATLYNITAAYSGDDNHAGSLSNTVTHRVNQASTTTQIDLSPDPITYGQVLQAQVTVSAGALHPGGSVSLTVDSGTPQTQTLTNGQTTFSLSGLSAGAHSLSAEYNGSTNFSTSTDTASPSLQKATATIQLSGLTPTYTGLPVNPGVTTQPEGLTVELRYDGSLTAPKNAGGYSLVATINDANYSGTQNGTLTISPARLRVTADNQIRRTGESNPGFTYNLSGFVNGEILATSGVSGSPSLSTPADLSSPVGQYPISVALGSLSATNYTFQLVKGTLTVHTPPTLQTAIADQTVTPGRTFVYSFPATTFTDADPGDSLSYTAHQVSGAALPAWLSFSPTTRTFSGNPPAAGVWSIRVQAVDRYGDPANADFDLNVVAPPPQNHAPTAVNDALTTRADTPANLNLLTNDSDPDGDTLQLVSVSLPAHGSIQIANTGQVTFTPDPLFHGVETVTSLISDGRGGTAHADLTLTTTEVAPKLSGVQDATSTLEDEPVEIPILQNDHFGSGEPPVVHSINNPPLHGSALLNDDQTVTYQPQGGFTGADSFTYLLSGGLGGGFLDFWLAGSSDEVEVRVTVVVGPQADVATAGEDSVEVQENDAVDFDPLVNDTVSVGTAALLGVQQPPAHGQVTINPDDSLHYVPDHNYSGSDSFVYSMGNGGLGFDTAQVTVTVHHVNQAPVATNDTASGQSGQPITIQVLANDSDTEDGAPALFSVNQPDHGTVEIAANGEDLVYTSADQYTGVDHFLYTIIDTDGAFNYANVTVQVETSTPPGTTLYFPLIYKSSFTSVYQQTFSTAAGSEWSTPVVTTSPSGEKFLGEFGNQTVSLDLRQLPTHQRVQVSFDLYILRSWDGNSSAYGPDQWSLLADGAPLLQTTFSNQGSSQAFPGSYPGADNAARSGAAQVDNLGYTFFITPMDTTYHLVYTFDHQADSLQLDFAALGLQNLADESWGVDNVQVSVE